MFLWCACWERELCVALALLPGPRYLGPAAAVQRCVSCPSRQQVLARRPKSQWGKELLAGGTVNSFVLIVSTVHDYCMNTVYCTLLFCGYTVYELFKKLVINILNDTIYYLV